MLHVVHTSLDTHEQHDMVLHNTKKYCLYIGVVNLVLWGASILSYQSTCGHPLERLKVGLALQVENSIMLSLVQNFFVLLMWVHGAFLVNVQKTYCHIELFMQWPNLMLKGLTTWVASLSHHLITQFKTNLLMLFHPMKYHKPIVELWCIYHNWTWSLTKKLYFNVKRAFLV